MLFLITLQFVYLFYNEFSLNKPSKIAMKLSVGFAGLLVAIWILHIHNIENAQPIDRERKDVENKKTSRKLWTNHEPFGAFVTA